MSLYSILKSQTCKNGLSNESITSNNVNVNNLLTLNVINADMLNVMITDVNENYNPSNNENYVIFKNNDLYFQKKINNIIYNQNEGFYLFNNNSCINIKNKIFKCDNNGIITESPNFLDKYSTPKKLYINHIICDLKEGSFFITNDEKIYIQINNNLKSIKIYD